MEKYQAYKELVAGKKMPCAILDQDLFNKNIDAIIDRCKGTKIRVASKSIRSFPALSAVINHNPSAFSGVMAFTLDEAVYLAEKGIKDILLGYPYTQKALLTKVAGAIKNGTTIVLMADLVEHLHLLNSIGEQQDVVMPVCLDIDMSIKYPAVYFGVYRSSLRKAEQLDDLLKDIKSLKNIKIVGAMGYEAQVAGVGDKVKGRTILNTAIQFLKRNSIAKIAKRRGDFVVKIEQILGYKLDLVNAGGTGSIDTSIQEDWVTEVTVGSGFYSPGLFDNYKDFQYEPALFYGLEVTRNPQENVYTASGGGYIASGSINIDKQPKPYLPTGIKLIKEEGTGEVQTPFKYKENKPLSIGDPIFFRHAKAGELNERFNSILVVSGGEIKDTYLTYRGEGHAFL